MVLWKVLLIFGFGCFVGAFVGMTIFALCQVASSADRHLEKMALDRYEKEKKEDQDSGLNYWD